MIAVVWFDFSVPDTSSLKSVGRASQAHSTSIQNLLNLLKFRYLHLYFIREHFTDLCFTF